MDSYDVIEMLERIKKEVKTKEPHELIDLINSEIDRIENNAED